MTGYAKKRIEWLTKVVRESSELVEQAKKEIDIRDKIIKETQDDNVAAWKLITEIRVALDSNMTKEKIAKVIDVKVAAQTNNLN